MYVKPCARCPKRATCETRRAKIIGVRGLKLGSISFRCAEILDLYKPGMRVLAQIAHGDREYEGWKSEFKVLGTVMAWKGSQVMVCTDDDGPEGTTSKAVVKLWPDRITATGETVPICRNCRRPMHRPIEDWKCNQYDNEETCVAGDPEAYFREKCAAQEGYNAA